MRILLDMDEVLCDFVGGALRVHGWTRKQLEQVWPVGTWSIIEPMGLTHDAFWKRIDAGGARFWRGLDPLPWAHDLIDWVTNTTDDWHIVTTPGHSVDCYVGKVRWLKWFFGERFDRFAITPHKHIFAAPHAILIDDKEETVRHFRRAGGRARLFPSRHNSLFEFANDPVGYLKLS